MEGRTAGHSDLSIKQIGIDWADWATVGPPSPDGRYLAYTNNKDDVAVFDLSSRTGRKLTHRDVKAKEWADTLTWAPDGTRIAYQWCNQDGYFDLRVIGFDGSNQKIVYKGKDTNAALNGWFPDGKYLLVSLHKKGEPVELARISLDDSSVQPIKTPGNFQYVLELSPDGRHIAYTSAPDDNQNCDLYLFPVSGGNEVRLSSDKSRVKLVAWDPDGRSILFTSDRGGSVDLWRIKVSEGKPHGEPEQVSANIGDVWPLGLTRQGSLFYEVFRTRSDVSMAALDLASGKLTNSSMRVNSNHIGSSTTPAWSPDGEYIAYLAAATQAERYSYGTLCIWSAKDGRQRESLLGIPIEIYPGISWSPNGQFIFGVHRTIEGRKLIRVNVRTGEIATAASNLRGSIVDWSPDGKTVYFRKEDQATLQTVLVAHESQTAQEREIYRLGRPSLLGTNSNSLSPDGKWIVIRTSSPKQAAPKSAKLLAIPTDGGAVRELLVTDKCISRACWTPDRKRILYYFYDGKTAEIWDMPMEGGAPRKLDQEMSKIGVQFPGLISSISFHPDGKRIAFVSFGPSEEGIYILENLPPLKTSGK